MAAVLAVACAKQPEPQSFGSAIPEPARGLAFVPGGRCNLEFVSGTGTRGGWRTGTLKPIVISGWALENATQTASPWVVVELVAPGDRARFFAVTTIRRPRPDVAAILGANGPGLQNAGFELVASADSLPRGRYAVYLLIGSAARGLACATGRILEFI